MRYNVGKRLQAELDERLEQVRDYVLSHPFCTTQELANEFKLTATTIRRYRDIIRAEWKSNGQT